MVDNSKSVGKQSKFLRPEAAFAFVILLGIVIRILFHPGALEPMHRVVVWPAIRITEGQFHPSSFAEFRHLLIFPAAASFSLFGVSLASLSLYPMLCSLGALLIAYAIGKRVAGVEAGLGAMFVLAVWPLDIFLAGRGEWPDGPQAFFASLALWLLLVAQDREFPRQRVALGVLAGAAMGLSCLVKQTTLFLLPAIVLYALVHKRARLAIIALPAGLILAFIGELVVDYRLTGDAFAGVRSLTNISVKAGSGGAEVLGYDVDQFSAYPKQLFVQPLMYGLHMYAAVGAIVFAIVRRREGTLLLVLWALWFFGYMWLGTINPTSWVRNSQFARYIALINVPLAALIAIWFSSFRTSVRSVAYAVVAAAGLFMANLNVGDQGEGTAAVQQAANFLSGRNDSLPIYSNLYTDSTLRFFLGRQSNHKVIAYGRSDGGEGGMVDEFGQVRGAYVLFDRGFVEEVLRRYPNQRYPKEIFSPPKHWEEVLVVNNPGRKSSYAQLRLIRAAAEIPVFPDGFRRKVTETIDKTLKDRDLVIYFVPAQAASSQNDGGKQT